MAEQEKRTADDAGALFADRSDETEVSPAPSPRYPLSATTAPPYRLSPGQQFGPYEIERILGRGGMGEVYEAVDTRSGHRVALKLLPRDASWSPERRERFLREGRVAGSISHTHSLFIYGTEEIEDVPVIAMEIASGGTLRDLVERDGPMPCARAVDAVLDMIEGLKAAHEAGVLHRDVKPANCFLDQWGRVKIGDYGLSLPTGDVDATRLTATGALLATPAFASPEQIRGEKLDLRADIYSVGATLYYILTGKTPFTGENPVQMLASVLSVPPEPPRTLRPEIPAELSRIVLQCLAKSAVERVRDYDELRSRLEPFGTAGLRPARLSDRFRAGLLDILLLSPVLFLFVFPSIRAGYREETLGEEPSRVVLGELWILLGLVVKAVYSALFEARAGRTPGQRILGISLTDPAGGPPTSRGILVRNLIYYAGPLLSFADFLWAPKGSHSSWAGPASAVLSISPLFLYVTAREGNGWTTQLDRWSGTRVVIKPRKTRALTAPAPRPADSDTQVETRIGPYDVIGQGATAPNRTVRARDPRSGRRVWIRIHESGTPPTPLSRRELVRPARLRWLNGSRLPELCWDAYEAPDGRSIGEMVSSPVPWATARPWLLSLAEELESVQKSQEEAPALSPNLTWITDRGEALLLDFSPPTDRPDEVQPDVRSSRRPEDAEMQRFLAIVAGLTLFGSGRVPSDDSEFMRHLRVPPPCSAIRIWRDASRGRFASLRALVDFMKASQHGESRTRSVRRLFQLLPLSILLVCTYVAVVISSSRLERSLYKNPELTKAYRAAIALHRTPHSPGAVRVPEDRRALEILLAGPLRGALPDTAVVSPGRGHRDNREIVRIWTRIAETNPTPSPDSVAWAESRLRSSTLRDVLADPHRATLLRSAYLGVAQVYALTGFLVAPFFLLFGFLFRGGLSLSLFNLVLLDSRGRPCSRKRALARSAITSLPLIVLWAYLAAHRQMPGPPAVACFAIFLAGGVWTIARPSRSLQDRLAGTWVVPR